MSESLGEKQAWMSAAECPEAPLWLCSPCRPCTVPVGPTGPTAATPSSTALPFLGTDRGKAGDTDPNDTCQNAERRGAQKQTFKQDAGTWGTQTRE